MNRTELIRTAIGVCIGGAALTAAYVAQAQPTPVPGLQSLKGFVAPEPRDLMLYVKDRKAAIVLGKALFWDAAVGSDGVTACASCHFHAGADDRVTNQLNPGLRNDHGAPIAATFNKPFYTEGGVQAFFTMGSNAVARPNYTLNKRDFPTHRLADPLDRNSAVLFDTDDVVSSQGVYSKTFSAVSTKGPLRHRRMEDCQLVDDPIFSLPDLNGTMHQTRRVEPRNTPTVINAAMNYRNFWDGRANNVFNGSSPFGNRDPDAGIWIYDPLNGYPAPTKIRIALENSSAASQAVGPPGSNFEMSCGGRLFADIGNKLINMRPLAQQNVAATDSVLGVYRAPNGSGLRQTYKQLVKNAFNPPYWNAPTMIDLGTPDSGPKYYTQMEVNFSLFFGLAVQMYESTLISDDAPLDRYLPHGDVAGDPSALTDQEVRGMAVFTHVGIETPAGTGVCSSCHKGPELTGAASLLQLASIQGELIEHMTFADAGVGINGNIGQYDDAFYNIGVRPSVEDRGVGAADPFGNPLSFTRQLKLEMQGYTVPDSFIGFNADPDFREVVEGAFKTPTLRNIELTGPYFHNGSRATLEQVIDFYSRGGDRRGPDGADTSAFGNASSNVDPDIIVRNFRDDEKADLAAFLKRPLTDERVRWERAPFDHPQLFVPVGHATNKNGSVKVDASGKAVQLKREIPAVGMEGRSAAIGSLQPFDAGLAP